MSRSIWKLLRKSFIFIIGVAVFIVGIILIPLPGPGFLVMFAGLAILAIEFEWAQRHHQRVKNTAKKVSDRVLKSAKDKDSENT